MPMPTPCSGLCLAHREQFADATAETRQAIHLAPDFPFAHFAHARVLFDRNRFAEALPAVNEAIRLEPEDSDQYALLANLHLQESRWREALHAAEQGLQFDPEHVGCTNLRAIALVKLGRKAEAGRTIDTALAKNPDNALTHANQGWTLLEQGQPKKAHEHFREALRLDPQNDWARRGIIEALKARNFIYALMLKYFLWMAKFSRGGQVGILLAAYFGNRILVAVAQANPGPGAVDFAVADSLPRLCPDDLAGVSPLQPVAAPEPLWPARAVPGPNRGHELVWALPAARPLGLAGCGLRGFDSPWLIMALVFGLLLLPVSAVFKCSAGWPRRAMAALTLVVALLGLVALARFFIDPESPLSSDLLQGFVVGVVASTWPATSSCCNGGNYDRKSSLLQFADCDRRILADAGRRNRIAGKSLAIIPTEPTVCRGCPAQNRPASMLIRNARGIHEHETSNCFFVRRRWPVHPAIVVLSVGHLCRAAGLLPPVAAQAMDDAALFDLPLDQLTGWKSMPASRPAPPNPFSPAGHRFRGHPAADPGIRRTGFVGYFNASARFLARLGCRILGGTDLPRVARAGRQGGARGGRHSNQ